MKLLNKIWPFGKREKELNIKELEKELTPKMTGETAHHYCQEGDSLEAEAYRVKNFQELFKIGRSFQKDFQAGVRKFAISSINYENSQQRCILGLASFFDLHESDLKIAIFSDNLHTGAFREMSESEWSEKYELTQGPLGFEVCRFGDRFDLVDLGQILSYSFLPAAKVGELLKEMLSTWDLVFFDVPTLEKIQSRFTEYYPLITCFESMSIIVAKNITGTEDLEKLSSFYQEHGISLKGLLFENF